MIMKKQILSLFAACLLVSLQVMAQAPTTNPMADFYGATDGYPGWSGRVKWNNVIDMSQYTNGATNFAKFENARDDLFNQGGGVLYYPAGTYTFDVPDGANGRGLMLKEGVVIRGDKPTTDDMAVTTLDRNQLSQHGLTSNPTKFVFTRNDFTDSLYTNKVAYAAATYNGAVLDTLSGPAGHVGHGS